MICINDKYADAIINDIRNQETNSDTLKTLLYTLGVKMGQTIVGDLFTEERSVITPMGLTHTGLHIANQRVVVISTKDDYKNFADGVASTMSDALRGYMDFSGIRGEKALSYPIRSMLLPENRSSGGVSCVIVAKSVLATGCTAISLTKKAIEAYNPRHIVIATVFYSDNGISEILQEIANADIYAFGSPDKMDKHGMLIPGVGNLDVRLKANN